MSTPAISANGLRRRFGRRFACVIALWAIFGAVAITYAMWCAWRAWHCVRARWDLLKHGF